MTVPDHAVGVANLNGAIALAKQALKSLEIANGGAVLIILTFYGSIARSGGADLVDLQVLKTGLLLFAGGFATAMSATGFAYFSQLVAATSVKARYEIPMRWASVVVAIISLVLFVVGGCLSINALGAGVSSQQSAGLDTKLSNNNLVLPSERFQFCLDHELRRGGAKGEAEIFCRTLFPKDEDQSASNHIFDGVSN